MTIIKPSTAFKAGADWVSAEVRSYMTDQVATHVDTVQDVRDNDFEQTRFLYVKTKAALYQLNLSSGAADDGDTVIRDNIGRRYEKVAGSVASLLGITQVDDLTARAAYDDEDEGFNILVSDTGDGRAAIYTMGDGGSADWSDPAYLTGNDGLPGTGIIWRGAWSAGEYDALDAVENGGSAYVANTTTTNEPPHADWDLLAAAGATGATGATGPANSLSIGTVEDGETAAATITGMAPTQALNLTLPAGPQGEQGEAFEPDEVVALIAGRAAFDNEAKNFAVLVESDATNDDLPTLYFKNSATSADWSEGFTFGGGGTSTVDAGSVIVLSMAFG